MDKIFLLKILDNKYLKIANSIKILNQIKIKITKANLWIKIRYKTNQISKLPKYHLCKVKCKMATKTFQKISLITNIMLHLQIN
jgi:hypothetical protein